MDNVKRLVDELRKRGLSNGAALGYHSGLMDEAADTIEQLRAKNEQLANELSGAYSGALNLIREKRSLEIENRELQTRKLSPKERLLGKTVYTSKNTEEAAVKLSEVNVYCFEAKLEYLDEYKEEKGEYFTVPYQVLAEDRHKARGMLEGWLSVPEQTGYKFKQCVGLLPQASKTLIVLDEQEREG